MQNRNTDSPAQAHDAVTTQSNHNQIQIVSTKWVESRYIKIPITEEETHVKYRGTERIRASSYERLWLAFGYGLGIFLCDAAVAITHMVLWLMQQYSPRIESR